MKANFASCIAPNGQIYVNDYMQVTNKDPTTASEHLPAR
jgi:hypothetical protein